VGADVTDHKMLVGADTGTVEGSSFHWALLVLLVV